METIVCITLFSVYFILNELYTKQYCEDEGSFLWDMFPILLYVGDFCEINVPMLKYPTNNGFHELFPITIPKFDS